MNKEIKIKVTIDGKEGIVVMSSMNVEYEKLLKYSKQLPSSITNIGRSGSQSFTGMNQVIGQTGFLLSDMDMFFRSNDWVTNVRMGTMSVANNFSMVGQTVANAMGQAKAAGLTFGQMLMSSLTPMNMALLGLNGLIFAVQLFTRFMSDGTKEVDTQATAVKKLRDEYELMTQQQLENKKAEKELALDKMTRELASKYSENAKLSESIPLIGAPVAELLNLFFDFNKMNAEEKKSYDLLLQENRALDQTISKHGYIKELEAQRKIWAEKRSELDEEHAGAFDKVIKYYDDLIHKANKGIEADKKRKTIYEQIGIVTDNELRTKIKLVEQALKETESVRETVELTKLLISLRLQLKEGAPSASDSKPYENPKIENVNGPLSYTLAVDKPASPIKESVSQLELQLELLQSLDVLWKRTGSIMSNSLSHAIVQGKQFNTVLKEMGQLLLQVIIQEGIELGVKALFSVFEKGGIVPKAANGYIVPGNSYTGDHVPILANSGEMILNGEQQANLFNLLNQRIIPQPSYMPQNNFMRIEVAPIQIEGKTILRGSDLVASYNKRTVILKKYYGKGI